MPPGVDRPLDNEYWVRCWSTVLFAGDLFVAVPFVDQPFQLYEAEADDSTRRHYVGQFSTGYGLMISPTCDLINQRAGDHRIHFACSCPSCRHPTSSNMSRISTWG
jgi:hypothetical protein